MVNMVKNNHLDPDIFKVFIEQEVYMEYANEYMEPGQIDEVPSDILRFIREFVA